MPLSYLDRIVCPVCKGSVKMSVCREELICPRCQLGFAIRANIPNMIAQHARELSKEEVVRLTQTPHPGEAAAQALREASKAKNNQDTASE